MKGTLKLVSMVIVGTALFGAVPSMAYAQEDITQKEISSLDLNQADVREGVRALFKNLNVSYSIDPEVQGPVTVNLKNVKFETALQNILRQVDATYRIEAGVYVIVKKKESIAPTISNPESGAGLSQSTKSMRRLHIRFMDPAVLAVLLGTKDGNQNYDLSPERSTIIKTQSNGGNSGSGFGSGSSGGSGFGGSSFGGNGNGGSGMGNGMGSGSGSGRGGFGG
jgi:uncharacterized membrane protein YgcG